MAVMISNLLPDTGPIKIIDVGAMDIGKDEEPYSRLLKAVPCTVVGFEPLQAELDKLQAMAAPHYTYLGHIIGDGSEQTFYECNVPFTSSLFEPDPMIVDQFHNLGSGMQVVKRARVATKRLDDIVEVRGADYLKVDVQGAELMVFQGATNVLKDTLVIHTEVNFAPMYRDMPLFGDIDVYLRSQGFLLHRLSSVSGRTFKPLVFQNDLNAVMSQPLWGDAIYVKSFTSFDTLPPVSLLKLATILHENYQSFDLVTVALREYDKLVGTALNRAYVSALTTP